MATRFAGLPTASFALRAALPPGFLADLARPEALTFLGPFALAFTEDFLTG